MSGKFIIIAAIVVYLGVMGCVVWPGGSVASPHAHVHPDLPGGGAAVADADLADDGDVYPPAASSHANAVTPKLEGLPYRGVAMQLQQIGDVTPFEKSI